MHVYLTVDVETYTGDYARDVQGFGEGLPYVVDTCCTHGLRATFFLEALGATRWGCGQVRAIGEQLRAAGQDVQLHLHPGVAALDEFVDHFDTMWRQDRATQTRLIREGLRTWAACGLGHAAAMRAGSLAANEDTLRAMLECDLRLSSNRDMDTKSSIESQLNEFFPARNDVSSRDGVVDLPVTSLRSPFPWFDGRCRHLEICAVGTLEMRDALRRLARAGYRCATILTHPQEFFRAEGRQVVPNRKNRKRWECLLRWLGERADMDVRTVGDSLAAEDIPAVSPPELTFNPCYTLVRLIQQARARLRWPGDRGPA